MCIGCGSCVSLCPNKWKMNDTDGKSDLIGGETKKNGMVVAEIDEIDKESNKDAINACPIQCISLNEK